MLNGTSSIIKAALDAAGGTQADERMAQTMEADLHNLFLAMLARGFLMRLDHAIRKMLLDAR